MSTTQPTQTHDSIGPTTQTDGDALAAIVAQTTQFDELPDFDVYRVACALITDSVKLASEGAI